MRARRQVLVNGGLILVIVLVIAGGGLYLWHPWQNASATTEATQLTTTVKQGEVSSTISATGAVAPVREVTESFAVSGTIATVDVSVGQTVAAGQQLGTLSTTELSATLSAASTSYTYAKQNLAAAQAQQNAQVSQVNSAKDALAQAAAAVTSAREDLAKATLTASTAGLVTAVNGEVGASSGSSSGSASSSGSSGTGAATGSTTGGSSSSSTTSSGFVTIADTSSYVVTANIAEADIADVSVGQAATITYPALASTVSSTATVTAISPTATSSNSVVSYATTITLTGPPAGLRLGQTADIAITTKASAADALYVPAAAITTADGTSTVKVVNATSGKTTVTDVTLGVVGDDGTEITKGLSAGQTIVLGTVTPATTSTTGTTGTGTNRRGFGTGGTGTGGTGGFPAGGTGGGFGGVPGGN